MPPLSCLCGQVEISLEERPDFIHECNCTFCAKTGAHWGYFNPAQVTVRGESHCYSRADKADPNARVQFCATCGSTTHFVLTDSAVAKFGNSVMGVNMLLADPLDLAGIELRYPDGKNWSGDGSFAYVSDPRVIGARAASD